MGGRRLASRIDYRRLSAERLLTKGVAMGEERPPVRQWPVRQPIVVSGNGSTAREQPEERALTASSTTAPRWSSAAAPRSPDIPVRLGQTTPPLRRSDIPVRLEQTPPPGDYRSTRDGQDCPSYMISLPRASAEPNRAPPRSPDIPVRLGQTADRPDKNVPPTS